MKRRHYYILGGILLLAFAGFSLASFKQNLTPYVSYADARVMKRTVQVAGALEKGSSSYEDASSSLLFTLRDPKGGEAMRVRYKGLKPANFEDAISIVAIGQYDAAAGELHADKLLVKCPSKYQGIDKTETKTYS
jgi:cytochrome c-type biogenesis protein CcmE